MNTASIFLILKMPHFPLKGLKIETVGLRTSFQALKLGTSCSKHALSSSLSHLQSISHYMNANVDTNINNNLNNCAKRIPTSTWSSLLEIILCDIIRQTVTHRFCFASIIKVDDSVKFSRFFVHLLMNHLVPILHCSNPF